MGVTETKITKRLSLLNNLNPNSYSYEFTPAKLLQVALLFTLLIILSCKCFNDLNIYSKDKLESNFIEIDNPKKPNVMGVIQRHSSMDLSDFNGSWPSQIMFTFTTGHVTGTQIVFHINENLCMVVP